jgi:RHH-type transcriptional regulator, rel operon repressor / antitoxin RelB
MSSDTVSARLPGSTKARLQQLAKSTGRRGALLAGEAIEEYLDINEWRVPGLLSAIASLDRGIGIPHERVKEWVTSWETRSERRSPRRI